MHNDDHAPSRWSGGASRDPADRPDPASPKDVRRTIVPIFATPISNVLWSDAAPLNRSLSCAIRELEASDPGIRRSNVGGWHSRTNLLDLDLDCVRQWRARVRAHLLLLFEAVAADPNDRRYGRFSMEAWANVLRYGQYNSLHSHPNAFWSGVYYVTGNAEARESHPFSGKLELLDPRPGASLNYAEGTHLYGRFLVNPSPGQMILFPGWLQHQVHPYFGEGERISIAFNVSLGSTPLT